MIDFSKLAEPFPPEEIKWRIQGKVYEDTMKAQAVAYVDARAVMDRLDAVCGPQNWQCRFPVVGPTTVCEIGIKTGDEWVYKSDGAGTTDIEAEKGQLSDAFKRTAVHWGIGRHLYHLPRRYVSVVKSGKSYRIADDELQGLMSLIDPTAAKVTGIRGLSKTTAEFWNRDKLIEPFTTEEVKQGGAESEDALRTWYSRVNKKIDKAPTREHLARYQADNQHIIDEMPSLGAEKLRDAFAIRAQQFDQFGD